MKSLPLAIERKFWGFRLFKITENYAFDIEAENPRKKDLIAGFQSTKVVQIVLLERFALQADFSFNL